MSFIAALFAGLAAWFMFAPNPRVRGVAQRIITPAQHISPRIITTVTVLMAAAAFIVLGGWLGLVAAAAVWLLAPAFWRRMLNRLDDDHLVVKQVAPIADMLAAAIAAGVHIDVALRALAQAVDDPAARILHRVVHARSLGASAEESWSGCPTPMLAIAQAIVRTERSGAGLVDVLHGVADDARRAHRTQVEVAARTAGVRAVAPLAACFLPAFLLVGVVPVVASLVVDFAW